jgi:hypothetical protein
MAEPHLASWKTTYPGIIPQAYIDGLRAEDGAARWRQSVSEATAIAFVAEDDASILGFASGERLCVRWMATTGNWARSIYWRRISAAARGLLIKMSCAADAQSGGRFMISATALLRFQLLSIVTHRMACARAIST